MRRHLRKSVRPSQKMDAQERVTRTRCVCLRGVRISESCCFYGRKLDAENDEFTNFDPIDR